MDQVAPQISQATVVLLATSFEGTIHHVLQHPYDFVAAIFHDIIIPTIKKIAELLANKHQNLTRMIICSTGTAGYING